VERKALDTPYGKPSAPYVIGKSGEIDVVFLPRHGIGHTIPPHRINYRANIWGMKELGVQYMICPSAVGSLRMDYKPGEICISDQFIDFTKKRELTFFDGPKVEHVSTADPFCEGLRKMLAEICEDNAIPYHPKGTYICIEGPRFSTRAESRMFKNFAEPGDGDRLRCLGGESGQHGRSSEDHGGQRRQDHHDNRGIHEKATCVEERMRLLILFLMPT
jgi:5'-methylthioadenosine phosphorylase